MAIAVIGVPVAFFLIGNMAYGFAYRFRGSFFPDQAFWLLLVFAAVVAGVIALSFQRNWSYSKRVGLCALYLLIMPWVLLVLQAVVSCTNRDCL